MVIESGVGHFELEQPGADQLVATRILDFLGKLRGACASGEAPPGEAEVKAEGEGAGPSGSASSS